MALTVDLDECQLGQAIRKGDLSLELVLLYTFCGDDPDGTDTLISAIHGFPNTAWIAGEVERYVAAMKATADLEE